MLGMREDGHRLVACYTGKPFEKLIDRCSRFQVFKQGLHWHTSASKDPRTTNFSFLPLNFRAIAPIQHDVHVMLGVSARQAT